MDKRTYDEQNLDQQLAYVNNLLASGQSLRTIASDLKFSKNTITNQLKRQGYVYDSYTKQFEPINESDTQILTNDIGMPQSSQESSKNTIHDDTIKDIIENTPKVITKDIKKDIDHGSTQFTIEAPIKDEPFNNRLVANVTKAQKDYVRTTSKKFENESSFVRFMIDYFIKNVNVK